MQNMQNMQITIATQLASAAAAYAKHTRRLAIAQVACGQAHRQWVHDTARRPRQPANHQRYLQRYQSAYTELARAQTRYSKIARETDEARAHLLHAQATERLADLEQQHVALDAEYWRLYYAAHRAACDGMDDAAATLRVKRDAARDVMKANEREQTQQRRNIARLERWTHEEPEAEWRPWLLKSED